MRRKASVYGIVRVGIVIMVESVVHDLRDRADVGVEASESAMCEEHYRGEGDKSMDHWASVTRALVLKCVDSLAAFVARIGS